MTKAGAKHKNDDDDDGDDVEKNDDDDEVDVMPKVSRATHTSKVLPTCNTSFALQHFFHQLPHHHLQGMYCIPCFCTSQPRLASSFRREHFLEEKTDIQHFCLLSMNQIVIERFCHLTSSAKLFRNLDCGGPSKCAKRSIVKRS